MYINLYLQKKLGRLEALVIFSNFFSKSSAFTKFRQIFLGVDLKSA